MNFNFWTQYFQYNQDHFDHIDWLQCQPLTPYERMVVERSIQQFQKGEYSEGKNLMKFAKGFAKKFPEHGEYANTIKHFIKEEQRHAMVLGRFMAQENIPKIKEHWIDDIFRYIRKLMGLELSITILATAEIISAVYYKGLKRATSSPILRTICQQILKDEAMHLAFQAYTKSIFMDKRSGIQNFFLKLGHHIFTSGTSLLVWFFHRKVLIKGGITLDVYLEEIDQEFRLLYANARNATLEREMMGEKRDNYNTEIRA
ncbi:ferritin-like domain-containing protein [Flexithrix dorotheae]|uniref:ferritin-like domain-containing protein n=1 Tax=Flexithrix dorotheae TaxID=70993 RepID=UPI00037ACC14|nr:ferritin-like domain-containing protein [Flexithrix dorotheae]